MIDTQDTIFHYAGFWNCKSKCRLRCYAGPLDESVVVATELPNNEGTSITNFCENLATQVCRQFGIAPERLLWIEHYDERSLPRSEWADWRPDGQDFSLVSFTLHYDLDGPRFTNPRWRPMSFAEVALLTDGALPD